MEPRYHDADGRIDYESVKAHALALRSQAIESAWRQLVQAVAGLIDGLRLDPTPAAGEPRVAHFSHPRHRSG
jgi:hypothetical protein